MSKNEERSSDDELQYLVGEFPGNRVHRVVLLMREHGELGVGQRLLKAVDGQLELRRGGVTAHQKQYRRLQRPHSGPVEAIRAERAVLADRRFDGREQTGPR